jgi:hypothetical protein
MPARASAGGGRLRAARHAARPVPPPIYFSYLGNAYYVSGDYGTAFNTLRTAMEKMPGYRAIPVWLAAAAA